MPVLIFLFLIRLHLEGRILKYFVKIEEEHFLGLKSSFPSLKIISSILVDPFTFTKRRRKREKRREKE